MDGNDANHDLKNNDSTSIFFKSFFGAVIGMEILTFLFSNANLFVIVSLCWRKTASGEGFCTAHTRQWYFLDRLDCEKYMDS